MRLFAGMFLAVLPLLPGAGTAPKAEIVDVKAIWSRAPHNAFTDLARFKDRWYCVFREGLAHGSPDGKIRVLTSLDGEVWTSAALLESNLGDLRDPKLSVTPDNYLMINGGVAVPDGEGVRHQSLVWFSQDGRQWPEPVEVADPRMWIWRVTWYQGRAYGMAYRKQGGRTLRFYTSKNGSDFQTLVEQPFTGDGASEATLLFLPDHSALCLMRREGESSAAQLGKAMPPYRGWKWTDLGIRVGGPNLVRVPDGRIVAAVRLYEPVPRTALCWLDPVQNRLTEFLTLPSGGDTSYAGLVFHQNLLWISYYSSHISKPMIYIAKVKLPTPPEEKPFDLNRYKGK